MYLIFFKDIKDMIRINKLKLDKILTQTKITYLQILVFIIRDSCPSIIFLSMFSE